MGPNALFISIIVILCIYFIFERTLAALNGSYATHPIPQILQGVYNEEEYARQQNYLQVNSRFNTITSTLSFAVIVLAFALGAFGWLDGIVGNWFSSPWGLSLIFFGILFIVNDLIGTPFDIYHTFVIEARFGFNKTIPKTFVLDKLKGYLLTAIIGGGLLSLIIYIYRQTPDWFWLIAWATVSIFSLFMTVFYSELIVPLFNKQTPLEPGALRDSIEVFAEKSGFRLQNIYVIDGSKRSTKANAYFSGLGKKHRIVLYDTLIEQLNGDEIVAVLAHEIGHKKHKHTLKNVLFSLLHHLLIFIVLGVVLRSDSLAQALGGSEASFHLNLLAFGVLYSPVSTLLELLMNLISRKYEYEADHFVKQNDLSAELISALKKISSQALSNLTPHPAFVFVHYSHPTLFQRVNRLLN